jgi:hypothetical protein
VEGDTNCLLPFFLKFLGESELNEAGVCFLIKLIDNRYTRDALEYNLTKILNLLLVYKGEYSFEVGLRVAGLVDKFSIKYPILRDIYLGVHDTGYSTVLKKIAFELQLGIPLEVD